MAERRLEKLADAIADLEREEWKSDKLLSNPSATVHSSEEISREELYIQREREQDMLYRQVRDADIFYSQGSLPESPSKVRASVEVEAWKSHLSNAMSQLRTLGQENLLPNPTWPANHHGGSEAEDFSSITHSGSTRNQQLSRPTSPPTPPPRIQAASAHGADDLSTSQWGLQESFSFATNISHSSPGGHGLYEHYQATGGTLTGVPLHILRDVSHRISPSRGGGGGGGGGRGVSASPSKAAAAGSRQPASSPSTRPPQPEGEGGRRQHKAVEEGEGSQDSIVKLEELMSLHFSTAPVFVSLFEAAASKRSPAPKASMEWIVWENWWEEAEGHVRLELKSALKSVFGTRCSVLFNSTKQGLITLYGLYSVEPDPMGNHQGGVSFEKMKERCPPAAVSLLEDAASHSLKLGATALAHPYDLMPWVRFWTEMEPGLREAVKAEVRGGIKREVQGRMGAWKSRFKMAFDQADVEGTGVAPVRLFAAALMEAAELARMLSFPAVPSVSPEWPSASNGWVAGGAQTSWIEEDTPGYG